MIERKTYILLASETKPLKQTKDSFKRIIITCDNHISHYNEEGILILNIHDFLLKHDALKM